MPAIHPATYAAIASSWWATFKRDRWVQLVVFVYAANAVRYRLFPAAVSGTHYTTTISLALALVALRVGCSRIAGREERRFWNDFSLAYLSWLAAQVVFMIYSSPENLVGLTLAADVGVGLYYVACIFALERKAHCGGGRQQQDLDHLLRWPAVVAFVIGLHCYFIVATALTDQALYLSAVPAVYLYLILDVYLVGRLVYLFRTVTTVRWQAIYSLLALTFSVSVVNDLGGLVVFQAAGSSSGLPALWNFMIVTFVLAVRLRHHPFPTTRGAPAQGTGEPALAEPRWQTLFFALVFPLMHFTLYGAGWLGASGRQARETILAVWLLLIGSVALLQYRLLERSKKEVEQDRDSLSDELAWRKKAEEERERLVAELEAKNAELERFTYTVSHDLKSPLVTIGGFLGFLKADIVAGSKDQVDTDLQRIHDAAGRMAQLLDELLDLSRIGRVSNPPQPVPLGELAREAVSVVQGWSSGKGPRVAIADPLPVVFGDRPRLLEVLQNLIENAVKFMGDQPRPRVEIGSRPGAEPPVFFVRDNGIGIEPQHHERVFGLFNRLAVDADGTGIGLTLVKRIIEVHGGRVWIESEGSGHGCTVCFTLPRPAAA